MDLLNLILPIFSSLLTFTVSYLFFKKKNEELDNSKYEIEKNMAVIENERIILVGQIALKNQEIELLKNNTQHHQDQISALEKRMALQFENISNKNIGHLLDPLKEKITTFQSKIEHLYTEEAKERHSLKNEIKNISEIGHQLNQEALNLTKALKGDVKMQGNWGEMVLEKILENSGLRRGEEFITQGEGLGLKTDEGAQQKPDVIIMLPENKHIIVDSKVSLNHYERYLATEVPAEKQQLLKLFNDSIEAHVKDLSKKDYAKLDKLDSPDFVLMFFPIEGAYSLAIQHNPNIFYWAWERSIIIVGPTTLMATLKTIHSIWRQEKSNQNAQAIANESGKMYDKMANFLEDLFKIGEQIKRTDDTFQSSLNKLKTGKGNVMSRLELIKKLGAKAKKQIDIQYEDMEFFE